MMFIKFLQIYFFAAIPLPCVMSVHYIYKGCFTNGVPNDLSFHAFASPGHNTISWCTAVCAFYNYTYAGLMNGESCDCGNQYGTYGAANENNCATYSCPGSAEQNCGGSDSYAVYEVQRNVLLLLASDIRPATSTSIGCGILGGASDSVFVDFQLFANTATSSVQSISFCTWTCLRFGFSYAGLKSDLCYCGNSYGSVGPAPSPSACDITCSVGSGTCGGNDVNYKYVSIYQVESPLRLVPIESELSPGIQKLLDNDVETCGDGIQWAEFKLNNVTFNTTFAVVLAGADGFQCGNASQLGSYSFSIVYEANMAVSPSVNARTKFRKCKQTETQACRFECLCPSSKCEMLMLKHDGCSGQTQGQVCEVTLE